MNVPITRRTSVASAGGTCPVTVNDGAWPWTTPSARFLSPSCANALLRIASIRPARLRAEATVKSHASYRLARPIFARFSAVKIRA